jgi:hypothetical protein
VGHDHRAKARLESTRYSSLLETLDSSEGCEITNASCVGTTEAVMPTVTGPNESRQWLGLDPPLRICRPRRASLVPKGRAMFHVKPRRGNEVQSRMEIPPVGPFPSAVSLGSGPPAGSEDQRDERQRAHWSRGSAPAPDGATVEAVSGAATHDPEVGALWWTVRRTAVLGFAVLRFGCVAAGVVRSPGRGCRGAAG